MNSYEKIYSALIEQYGHGSLPKKPTNSQNNNGKEDNEGMTPQELMHYLHRPSRRKTILTKQSKIKEIFKKLFGK